MPSGARICASPPSEARKPRRAERIVPTGVEDHDVEPRAGALHLAQHEVHVDHLEIDVGLARRIGGDRHELVGAGTWTPWPA